MSSLLKHLFARSSVVAPLLALLSVSAAAGQSVASADGARSAGAGNAPFVVIVNAANPIAALERDDLSKMFFKRLVKWPHGASVDPVDLSPVIPSRVAFTRSVHRKSVGAVRAFWQQQIFSGRNVPPSEKGSDADVVQYVSQHPGAVGYVSSTQQLQKGVKPIEVRGITQ